MENLSLMRNPLVDPKAVHRWDKILKSGSDKRYPSLELVRLERWYFGGKPGKVLDYGFGSGVNLIHLLECGYEVYGIDASIEAKRLVEKKLASRPDIRSKASLEHIGSEAIRLPYDDNTFDYVVCLSVLSLLGLKARVRHLLQEFLRVMKPGAKIVVDINGINSDFALKGEPTGDDTYTYQGTEESGVIYCYCVDDKGKFLGLLEGFVIDEVGYAGHRYMGSEIYEYIACARKPAGDVP